MNVLVYIPFLTQKSGGTRQYALGLLKVLEKDFSNKYFILSTNGDVELSNIIEDSSRTDFKLISSDFEQESKFERMLLNFTRLVNFILIRLQYKRRIKYYSYLNRIVNKYQIDIVHSPFQYTPYVNVKSICTMHDVQELHFPEYFTPFDRFIRSFNYMDCLDRASHIIVSYEHVKNDLIKYFNIFPDKISVILLDFNDFWFNKFLHSSQNESVPFENIPSKFILYPANTWPHKNHINLLKAIAEISDCNVNLVCTGAISEYYDASIYPEIVKLNLSSKVYFMGVQDEKSLYSLYQNAFFIIVPTQYEAGSFPLIESIFLERPVICSNVTSLPDTIGNSEFIFSPSDIHEMSSLIRKMYIDESFRNRSMENSKIQKQKLMVSQCIDNLVSSYNKLV